MKRLITILVVSVLSVISINSSTFAAEDTECQFCKNYMWQIIQDVADTVSDCDEERWANKMEDECTAGFSGNQLSMCLSYGFQKDASDCVDYHAGTWSSAEDYCSYKGKCQSVSTSCPADCKTGVTYQDMGNDDVRVTTTYCDSSTNYECRTKTETIAISNDNWFQDGSECAAGTCTDWNCKWTVAAGGTTCSNPGAGATKPFCTCVMKEGTSLRTVAVRLWCNSTTNTGYNCNGNVGSDDDGVNGLYCDLTYGNNAGTGICRYKKTCTTDCASTNTNAWNVLGTTYSTKLIMYRLKKSCDYTTGSCVSSGGTAASDFDYKCNRDNRAYETGTVTCTKMRSGKPTSCSGCAACSSTVQWENASNPAYRQQYHYNFSPISGTDRYQCVKTMDSLYQCNAGYYGNPGSSMTGCNACPTLEQSNLTIVSQNDACTGYHFVYTATFGATSINDCYASTGNDGSDPTYCVAKMSDGTGTFYWSYNDAVASTGNCNWQ